MSKGNAYIGITSYLEKCNRTSITMSFMDVKKVNGDHLPMSAYKHNAWWSNTESHSQAFGWMNAGYRTTDVDIIAQRVTFEK